MQRAIKVELDPNNRQQTMLWKFAGTARFAWNWGLTQRKKRYHRKTGDDRFTDAMKQHKKLNRLKKGKFSWMYKISKCVPQESLRDLDQAFRNYFRDPSQWGYPRFKKKGRCRDSFRLTGTIRVRDRSCRKTGKNHTCTNACKINSSTGIQLPRLGLIRLKEVPDLTDCHVQSATVSRTADRWFVSLSVRKPDPVREVSEDPVIIGVDLGLKTLVSSSDGVVYDNPRHLQSRLRKLRRLQKAVSRKQYKSSNYYKAQMRVARLHKKIADIRRDRLHQITTTISRKCDVVVIEDLAVSNMMKNSKLARAIADVGWRAFREMLEYKCEAVIVVPRFFPSSKLCSDCWHRNDGLKLADRIFSCERCGMEKDRDLNAAENLELYGQMYLICPSVADSWSDTINACGEGVRPLDAYRSLIGADESGNLCEAGSQHV